MRVRGVSGGIRVVRAFPCAHVRVDEVDLVVPFFLVVTLEEDVGVWVFLDGPEVDGHAGVFGGFQGSGDEWASACSGDADDEFRGSCIRWLGAPEAFFTPIDEGFADCGFVEVVFDGVFFKDFVGQGF